MDTHQVKVARRTQETPDICVLELVACDGAPLPSFSAGSHVDVYLPGDVTRQYSLCNDSSDRHRYMLGVLREQAGRGGSAAMHALQVGDTLKISTPKNHFALAGTENRSLLIAGGIGVTPILCMAERLSVLGADFEMHYCTRSAQRTAFRGRIGEAPFADRVRFHFDDGAPEQRFELARVLGEQPAGTHLYVCGPKGLMDAVLDAARKSGWPGDRLHYEFFAGTAPIAIEGDSPFDVKIASTGQLIRVDTGKTVVECLAAAGIHVDTSCEQGVCGTCLTRVLEGEPDHRDIYLIPEERARNDAFLPCCSRSKSPVLVLDL